MAGRRPETIAKREKEQARREKRERKQAKKDARALGEAPVTDETAAGETPLDDVQLDADVAAGESLD
jgi:uncharacterized membrane protein YdbT with pleckstrin-like domain